MFPLRRSDTQVKSSKPKLRESHVAFTTHGTGDYFGTGVRNPQGRVRDETLGFKPVTPKELKTPPKSVV